MVLLHLQVGLEAPGRVPTPILKSITLVQTPRGKNKGKKNGEGEGVGAARCGAMQDETRCFWSKSFCY